MVTIWRLSLLRANPLREYVVSARKHSFSIPNDSKIQWIQGLLCNEVILSNDLLKYPVQDIRFVNTILDFHSYSE